ncbi:hypothetical protein F511_17103 [Dorcoceras hygrometricum]|uniref:Uncharacterized protein n=1 Tax=Dorcoceras hygrometricum TaxID=472368 RepID=A0A2Z7BCT4_9LAMI|nr:hypothetical protein F511_17103 [Dorcoceras hygrometricum]
MHAGYLPPTHAHTNTLFSPNLVAQLTSNRVKSGICETTSRRFHSTSVYTGNPKRRCTASRSGQPAHSNLESTNRSTPKHEPNRSTQRYHLTITEHFSPARGSSTQICPHPKLISTNSIDQFS